MNLLPAFWDAKSAAKHEMKIRQDEKHDKNSLTKLDEYGWVAKPKFGREGMGIRYFFGDASSHCSQDSTASSLDRFLRQVDAQLDGLNHTKDNFSPDHILQVRERERETYVYIYIYINLSPFLYISVSICLSRAYICT